MNEWMATLDDGYVYDFDCGSGFMEEYLSPKSSGCID